MSEDTVRVAVRVRPLVKNEINKGCQMCLEVIPGEQQVVIKNTDKAFTFNYVIPPEIDQEEFYDTAVKDIVKNIFHGYNVTVLAYGQTGSGKTHSMGTNYDANESSGVIPRAVHDMFKIMNSKPDWSFRVGVSFMELYQEQLYDLLCTKERNQSIVDIREDSKGIRIPGVTEIVVQNAEEALQCLTRGSAGRATGATAMNAQSSRSHAIYTLCIQQQKIGDSNTATTAKFHLVDLAGSERSKKTGATGERFKEGVNINKGLLALGNVISQLGEGGSVSYVGYRDSKLTRLLQDSLGGNSMTLMIACVSPADYNLEETLSTLRYADRARKIKNKPIVNQDPQISEINRLNKVIQELRLALVSQEALASCPGEHKMLEEQNRALHQKVRDLTERLNSNLVEMLMMHERAELAEQSREKIQSDIAIIIEDFEHLLQDLVLDSESRGKLQAVHLKLLDIQNNQKKTKEDLIKHGITMENNSKDHTSMEEADISEDAAHDIEIEETQKYFDEKNEKHTMRQVERVEEVHNINRELALKEGLINQLLMNSVQFHDQLKEVQQMEQDLKTLKSEKEDLLQALQNAHANNASSKLAETRRKKVQELEKRITDLTRKCTELNRVLKTKEKQDQQIKNLSGEILSLKQTRVKLIRQMRDETEKFASWKKMKEKELINGKAHERKLLNEMTRMRLKCHKQETVLKRKIEEVTAVKKRLKEALELQKTAAQRADKASNHKDIIQAWVTQEFEVTVSTFEAEYSLQKLMQERSTMTAELHDLKNNSEPDAEQVQSISNYLDLCNAQIADLQERIMESDQETRANTRMQSIRNIADAKTAWKILFDISAQNQRKMCFAYNDIMKKYELLQEKFHKEKRLSRQIILNNSDNDADNTNNDSTIDLKKELEFFKKRCTQLEQGVLAEINENGKEQQAPKLKPPRTQSRSFKEEEENNYGHQNQSIMSDDSVIMEDDIKRDPDWRETPLYSRIQSLWRTTRESTATRTTFKRSSDGNVKCACKTKCATRICSCRKNEVTCSNCGCDPLQCLNRDQENVVRTLFTDNPNATFVADTGKKPKLV